MSIQQIIEEAVAASLSGARDQTTGTTSVAAATKTERDFLDEMLDFFRHAEPELIRQVRGLSRTIAKLHGAKAQAAQQRKKTG